MKEVFVAKIEQLKREIAHREQLISSYLVVLGDLEGKPYGLERWVHPKSKTDLVLEAVDEMPAEFRVRDVHALLRSRGSDLSRVHISAVIGRCRKEGRLNLKVHNPAAGPHGYSFYKQPQQPNDESATVSRTNPDR